MLTALWLTPEGMTSAALCAELGLGRATVNRRLHDGQRRGLLSTAGRAPSTGGRSPVIWRFEKTAGAVAVLCVNIRSSLVALTDLRGRVLAREDWGQGVIDPPLDVARSAAHRLDLLLARSGMRPWGLGVTVPTPVEAATGRPVALLERDRLDSPWVGFNLGGWLADRTGLPVSVEDEITAMSLTAARRPGAPASLLYVRMSAGLGLGIVSDHRVHRGATDTSGEFGHIQVYSSSSRQCRCGRMGCLEAYVSGSALEQEASQRSVRLVSQVLLRSYDRHGRVWMEDLFAGAAQGDATCVNLLTRAGTRLGAVLALLATVYSPGEIVVGGKVTASGRLFASAVEQALRQRVLPVTARRLRVRPGGGAEQDEITGAVWSVVDRALAADELARWFEIGSPARARNDTALPAR